MPQDVAQGSSQVEKKGDFWDEGAYYVILVLFILTLFGGLFVFLYPHLFSQISVANQKVGESVKVEKATLTSPGWVVVKLNNQFNKPGEVVGQTPYLLPGTYENFHIEFEPVETLVAEGVLEESYRDSGFTKGENLYVQVLEDKEISGQGIDREADEAAIILFSEEVEKRIMLE